MYFISSRGQPKNYGSPVSGFVGTLATLDSKNSACYEMSLSASDLDGLF
jgi:hypothetical protein